MPPISPCCELPAAPCAGKAPPAKGGRSTAAQRSPVTWTLSHATLPATQPLKTFTTNTEFA